MEFEYTVPSLTAILSSAVLALLVNLSIFMVIGKTSPIAYNVLGHFKLCVILASGFVFFGEEANPVKVTGTIMTVIGVVLYTHLQQSLKSGWEQREKAAQVNNREVPLSSIKVTSNSNQQEEEEEEKDKEPLIAQK